MRVLMLCDWLPPDFGAVGQYMLADAHELSIRGNEVTVVGFTSGQARVDATLAGSGTLVVRRLRRAAYDRQAWLQRALWTLRANLALLWGARDELWRCEELRFTGSPPYLLHFAMPVCVVLRKRTHYRITDFHPECLVAALERSPWWLRLLEMVTRFWRRQVDTIEILGEDQRARIADSGVDPARVVLRRDPSPVVFAPDTRAADIPAQLRGRRVVLYSGNWGVAHDHATFVAGLARFEALHPGVAGLWLNATGGRADTVEADARARGLVLARTAPVPLSQLASVLLAADVHLITLDDRFVGYVLPSKIYACIGSGRPILFVGSARSDVHLLCELQMPRSKYRRVDVGDIAGVARGLHELLQPEATGTREEDAVA